jgi:hypothetical protein
VAEWTNYQQEEDSRATEEKKKKDTDASVTLLLGLAKGGNKNEPSLLFPIYHRNCQIYHILETTNKKL